MEAKVATYGMYFHLYREIEGRHFVGMIDHRIGQLISELTPEQVSKLKFREPIISKVLFDNGEVIHYIDEPYKPNVIETFNSFDLETMVKLVNN